VGNASLAYIRYGHGLDPSTRGLDLVGLDKLAPVLGFYITYSTGC